MFQYGTGTLLIGLPASSLLIYPQVVIRSNYLISNSGNAIIEMALLSIGWHSHQQNKFLTYVELRAVFSLQCQTFYFWKDLGPEMRLRKTK